MDNNDYFKKCIKCSEEYLSEGKKLGVCLKCSSEIIEELYEENIQLKKDNYRLEVLYKEATSETFLKIQYV